MKFNKEEISLCEQVAERYKKPIEYGDWVNCDDNQFIFISEHRKQALVYYEGYELSHRLLTQEVIPLWTISDCLEFLEERKWHISHCFEAMNKKYHSFMIKIAENHVSSEDSRYRDAIGETLLEACLKAVLAVLEEE